MTTTTRGRARWSAGARLTACIGAACLLLSGLGGCSYLETHDAAHLAPSIRASSSAGRSGDRCTPARSGTTSAPPTTRCSASGAEPSPCRVRAVLILSIIERSRTQIVIGEPQAAETACRRSRSPQ